MPTAPPNLSFITKAFRGIKMGPIPIYYASWFGNIVHLTPPAKDLLQTVGLAGLREGEVSLDGQHPQFMIAHSGATSEQCLRLIERVREQVLLQTP